MQKEQISKDEMIFDGPVDFINYKIHRLNQEGGDSNLVSDGYHTFGELYEHRITLFIVLCKNMDILYSLSSTSNQLDECVWRSKKHSDGTEYKDWFLMGIGKEKGNQITYHLPISKWDETDFAETLEQAPEFDGHTSADVLERLRQL